MQNADLTIISTVEDAKAAFNLKALHTHAYTHIGLIYDPAKNAFYAGFYRRSEYAGTSLLLTQPALSGLVNAFIDKTGARALAYRDNETAQNGRWHHAAGAGGQMIFITASPDDHHIAGARIQIEKVLPALRDGMKAMARYQKAQQSVVANQGRALTHVWSEQMHIAYKAINPNYALPFEATPAAPLMKAYMR